MCAKETLFCVSTLYCTDVTSDSVTEYDVIIKILVLRYDIATSFKYCILYKQIFVSKENSHSLILAIYQPAKTNIFYNNITHIVL